MALVILAQLLLLPNDRARLALPDVTRPRKEEGMKVRTVLFILIVLTLIMAVVTHTLVITHVG